MAMTAPGIRPASMSAFSVAAIRASRSLERPTSSGLARGSGSSANAALDASTQNAVARILMAAMDVSRFGLCGPVCREDYGNAAGEASAGDGHFQWAYAHCATPWVGASSIDKNHILGEHRHGRIVTPSFSRPYRI